MPLLRFWAIVNGGLWALLSPAQFMWLLSLFSCSYDEIFSTVVRQPNYNKSCSSTIFLSVESYGKLVDQLNPIEPSFATKRVFEYGNSNGYLNLDFNLLVFLKHFDDLI